jgi:hypothetical protein
MCATCVSQVALACATLSTRVDLSRAVEFTTIVTNEVSFPVCPPSLSVPRPAQTVEPAFLSAGVMKVSQFISGSRPDCKKGDIPVQQTRRQFQTDDGLSGEPLGCVCVCHCVCDVRWCTLRSERPLHRLGIISRGVPCTHVTGACGGSEECVTFRFKGGSFTQRCS